MDRPIDWRLWSAEEIAEALPEWLRTVEARPDDFPEEHREKNQAAVQALKVEVPTAAQVREGSRNRDLGTLGFALDVLGRRSARQGEIAEALRYFQAAHELFRRGNPLIRATRPMRQALGNALKVLAAHEVGQARLGETSANAAREALQGFVASAWGSVPSQLALEIDEMLLIELERVRAGAEQDPAVQEALVRDNIETVLALEVPARLEWIRQRWEEIGERVAPAAARRAQRAARRALPLSSLLPPAIWTEIGQAVEQGDAQALADVLADARDELETNLRLRLDAKAEYREPVSEIRLGGGPDPAFVEARERLLRQDSEALAAFSNLHYRRSANTIAKEWYAYALTLFGRPTDIHDVIELLDAAIRSDRYREERGWTARWNLACALRRLPTRAEEALDVLLPVLDADVHIAEAFELCLLWAIEQGRMDVLPALLPRARHYEAHLLAALADAETPGDPGAVARFRDHFRRINRILRDPDRLLPDPRERLTFDELDQLTREFIETSLVPAGVEWFRQRVAHGSEGSLFKNWECAGVLQEEAGDLAASWRCRREAWRTTQHRRNVDARRKTQLLRGLLGWGLRHGMAEDALRVLQLSWRETTMTEADVRVWVERLAPGPAAPAAGGSPDDAAGEPAEAPAVPVRASQGVAASGGRGPEGGGRRPAVALMLDWENVKIGLARHLEELPEAAAGLLRARLSGVELATRLLEAAWRHGLPRQRWAVADWDRPFFEGDQKAVRNARFWSDIASGEKANASDHVLREKIHLVLRQHPDIGTFVIGTGDGDFHEVIKTLQREGKQVILWSTRRALSEAYGESLRGPDRIRIEWLEDLVFG
jgi:hypothetical protein